MKPALKEAMEEHAPAPKPVDRVADCDQLRVAGGKCHTATTELFGPAIAKIAMPTAGKM
jgi:cytochrome c551/c552